MSVGKERVRIPRRGTGLLTVVRKKRPLVSRSNIAGSWTGAGLPHQKHQRCVFSGSSERRMPSALSGSCHAPFWSCVQVGSRRMPRWGLSRVQRRVGLVCGAASRPIWVSATGHALWGRFCTARARRPLVSWIARYHPATAHNQRSIRPQGKNSRFRQQSGIFSLKRRLIWVFGSKNLSSPAFGDTVVAAVTVAIGVNRSETAYFLHSTGTPHGATPLGAHLMP